jgi:hypothetical protein
VLQESGAIADRYFTGTRQCSDLAALVAVVSVSREEGPPSTALVASAAPLEAR